ncbi:hypothetical protein BIW11_04460 [Tropilaelaps mercedesae]|uniref:MINDY4 N-terminal dimerisation domain-containing protein n=1 Tax=Tropilaelaps mercedesae TaxID=418985 RepID=A0A1V9X661_9ACAR|nr:hypothetical protein BIW11_04460 [Tropilaelaps mercedesae]
MFPDSVFHVFSKRGLEDVLHALEEAFPRSPHCFQHRDQLIRAISLEKAAKENKVFT